MPPYSEGMDESVEATRMERDALGEFAVPAGALYGIDTARAIENTVHVVAADHAPPIGTGCSMILDPMGVTLASLGEQHGTAIADLDPERTAAVRRINPGLANRRYRVLPR